MGVRAERLTRAVPRGAALPAALFGLVTVSVLATAIFAASSMQQGSTRNREGSARALQLAETGLAHAVTVVRDTLKGQPFTRLLRGSDNSINTADDGRVIGFGMSSAITIPVAGRAFGDGSYTAVITDDVDGDGNLLADANYRVKLRCDATTSDGGRASLEVILGTQVLPAIASNGDLSLSGDAKILGYCGSVHANDDLTISASNVVVAGGASASDVVSGSVKDTLGVLKPVLGGRDTVSIPTLSYADFCGAPGTNATTNRTDVDFWFTSTGYIYQKGNPTPYNANGTKQFGWVRASSSPVVWDFSNPTATPGKMCIEGNVKISGNVGSATMPMAWSIISTGSVEISGNPYLVPMGGDSISIVAMGDVSISGNPIGTARSYEGMIYAGAQCKISGNPSLQGQVLCKDGANPAGAVQYASMNEISGNPTLRYGCGGMFARRRIYSWLQRVE